LSASFSLPLESPAPMALLETTARPTDLYAFTHGIDTDQPLAAAEVAVQRAWAVGLKDAGFLTAKEAKDADRILKEALKAMQDGSFVWKIEDEDIHMNLERFVTERAAGLGKKLHTGRSRNDLIATTLRLFVRDQMAEIDGLLANLTRAIADKADDTLPVIIPGMTHLQSGQPVRFGHALAAHGHAFKRDSRRLNAAASGAMEVMPLGAAALAGTHIDIDLKAVAKLLGFAAAPRNSYDSVGDRDFMLEAMNALALMGVHLSRYAEEVMYWASSAVGVLILPPDWSTGSSIMPNKRNPDVPELVRAKAARLIAAATEGQMLVRAVVPSYGSDLHELKRTLMRATSEAISCLTVLIPFTAGLTIRQDAADRILNSGHILATEIANHLAAIGVPFRDAYKQVAALCAAADKKGVQVHALDAATIAPIAPKLTPAFMKTLSFTATVEARKNSGGTSLKTAKAGIAGLRKR
jgi:argininosuccinate lyase